MKKLMSVSVGIPAFNEANNIERVVRQILKQNQAGWKLKEVLIYDDGSSDGTSEKVKKVNNRLIKLFASKDRKGKTYRLSQMFKQFSGDVLIMLDGDIEFSDQGVLTELIKPFSEKNVMLIGGNSTPFPPKSFFEKSVYSTFEVFYKSRKKIRGGNNVFGCTGSILAIGKKFAREIKMPLVINEDVFIYLDCVRKGYKFVYQDQAVIYYKLPTNLIDYLKQAFRSNPEAVEVELDRYFGDLLKKEFYRPLSFYFLSIFEVFLKQPLELIFIVFINVFCKPFYPIISKNYKLDWFTASSTH